MQPEPDTQVLPPRSGREERAAQARAAQARAAEERAAEERTVEGRTIITEERSVEERPPEPGSGEAVILQRWVGRYELIQRLAHGGMATVYLGRAKGKAGFEKVVAVKVIHPHLADELEFVGMFLDEARIAARIQHPHVVQILDLGEANGAYHMVMEFIEGDNLAALVRALAGERLPISVILQLLADTLEGLAAAHDLRDGDGQLYGLVHRDVSPHNILINLDGWAKVGDFGVMKAAGKHSNTKTGELRGKLAYMSPEQARGGRVDLRTDLFAVGVICWELLAGRRLFACETEAATLEKVFACEVPALDCGPEGERPELDRERWPERGELAEGLEALLRRALAPQPEQRFVDAPQMLAEIKRLARLCEACLGDDGCPEPRAFLGKLMNRFFRGRVDYARAALRRTGEYEALSPGASGPRGRTWAVEATVRVPTGSNPTITDASMEGSREALQLIAARPTTASHAAADAPVSIPREPTASVQSVGGHWLLWLLLPMLGAAIAVAVLLWLGLLGQPQRVEAVGQPAPTPADETATERAADPSAAEIQWFFFTTPPGATVTIDGERWAELTPTQVSLPRGKQAVDIVIELDGYQSKRRKLVPLSSQNFNEVLSPLESPAQPMAAVEVEAPRIRSRSSKTKLKSKENDKSGDASAGKSETAPRSFLPPSKDLK